MSETVYDQEVATITLPRVNMYLGSTKRGDMPAFPLSSMFVSGTSGSGKTTLRNNLISNLISCTRSENVRLYLLSEEPDDVWVKTMDPACRIENLVYADSIRTNDPIESVNRFLCRAFGSIMQREHCTESRHFPREVYILDTFTSGIWEWMQVRRGEPTLEEIFEDFYRRGDAVGVHLIFFANGCYFADSTMQWIKTRAVLWADAETSDKVLGCNIAKNDTERYGHVWVAVPWEDVPMKLWFSCKSMAHIWKFIKLYSKKMTREDADGSIHVEYGIPWSVEEDNVLRQCYPSMGKGAATRLVGRSMIECVARAGELGITREIIRCWTEEEDNILRKFYPDYGNNIAAKLEGRTPSACRNRAAKLGLKYNGSNQPVQIKPGPVSVDMEVIRGLTGLSSEDLKS